jgi:hypothetical protein
LVCYCASEYIGNTKPNDLRNPERNDLPIREDERLSAEALKTYLQDRLGYTASWSAVAADPPDLEFYVIRSPKKSERWGVEVTGLFQYAEWEGAEVTRLAFEPKLHKMIERFSSDGPLPIKLLNALPKLILEYIRSGQQAEVALDHAEAVETVCGQMNADRDDPFVHAVLQQVAHEYERVRMMATPGKPGIHLVSLIPAVARIPHSNKRIGDIQESVTYSVNRILDAKLPKLAKITGFDRRILLIWSGFVLADASEVVKAIALRNLSITDVDAVFFVDFGWKAASLVSNFAGIG